MEIITTKDGDLVIKPNQIDSFDGTQDLKLYKNHQLKSVMVSGDIVDDSTLVHLAGTETITGTKTFNSPITTTQFKLSDLNTAPLSATDTGVKGEIRITIDAIYVCIATNTWVKCVLATWI